MPRYFFDINDHVKQDRDDVGQDLPNLEAARDAAIEVLRDIACDVSPDGDWREITSSVRTDQDGVVFRAKLSLTTEWVGANDP